MQYTGSEARYLVYYMIQQSCKKIAGENYDNILIIIIIIVLFIKRNTHYARGAVQ